MFDRNLTKCLRAAILRKIQVDGLVKLGNMSYNNICKCLRMLSMAVGLFISYVYKMFRETSISYP